MGTSCPRAKLENYAVKRAGVIKFWAPTLISGTMHGAPTVNLGTLIQRLFYAAAACCHSCVIDAEASRVSG